MTNFSTLFLAHFWSISPILGVKRFFRKIWPCHAHLIWVFSTKPKFRKNLYNSKRMPEQMGGWKHGKRHGRTDGKNLLYRTVLCTTRGPIKYFVTIYGV